jgi:hypothetical protein
MRIRSFGTLEVFSHPIAVDHKRELLTGPDPTNPIRERGEFDFVAAELSILIDGMGARKGKKLREVGHVSF